MIHYYKRFLILCCSDSIYNCYSYYAHYEIDYYIVCNTLVYIIILLVILIIIFHVNSFNKAEVPFLWYKKYTYSLKIICNGTLIMITTFTMYFYQSSSNNHPIGCLVLFSLWSFAFPFFPKTVLPVRALPFGVRAL